MGLPLTGALVLSNPRHRSKIPKSRLFLRLKNSRALAGIVGRTNRKHKARRRNGGIAFRRNGGIGLKLNSSLKGLFSKSRRSNKRRRSGRKARSFKLKLNGLFGGIARTNRKARRSNKRRYNKGRKGFKLNRNRRGARRYNRRSNGIGRQLNRRRNGIRRNRNPGLPGVSFVTNLLKKIPFVGKYAAAAYGPALAGAVCILGTHLLLKYTAPYIPESIAGYIQPIGYTIAGVLVGIGIAMVPTKYLSSSTKTKLAITAASVGGAVDALRFAGDKLDFAGGIGLGNLSDGGLWQLGAVDYGEMDGDECAIMSDYSDAQPQDAHQVVQPAPHEAMAAAAGPREWRLRFPPIRTMFKEQDGFSRHAGKEGHRWGWLIRMIGFKPFANLMQAPPAVRDNYLAQLKASACALIPEPVQIAPPSMVPASQALSGWGSALYAQ